MRLYRISHIARKLKISATNIFDILSRNGFELEYSPNYKITELQLDVLIGELSIELDNQVRENISIKHLANSEPPLELWNITDDLSIDGSDEQRSFHSDIVNRILEFFRKSDFTYEEYDAKRNYVKDFRRYLKRLVKGIFKGKRRFYNIKKLIQTIFNPCLYYIFSSDEDEIEKFPTGASLSLN